jgi:hypothetical protein
MASELHNLKDRLEKYIACKKERIHMLQILDRHSRVLVSRDGLIKELEAFANVVREAAYTNIINSLNVIEAQIQAIIE